jgi:hypothetical protein
LINAADIHCDEELSGSQQWLFELGRQNVHDRSVEGCRINLPSRLDTSSIHAHRIHLDIALALGSVDKLPNCQVALDDSFRPQRDLGSVCRAFLPPFVTQVIGSDQATVLIAKLPLASRNSSIVFSTIAWTFDI